MTKDHGVLRDVTCEDFIELTLQPENFWQGVTSIGPNAFIKIPHKETLVVPEGITYLYDGAFEHSPFNKIILPSTLTSMGCNVFKGSYNLEQILVILK